MPNSPNCTTILGAIFDGAVGFAALQAKDLATAQKDMEEAVSWSLSPISPISILWRPPIWNQADEPCGFWFIVKAANLAQGPDHPADPGLRP